MLRKGGHLQNVADAGGSTVYPDFDTGDTNSHSNILCKVSHPFGALARYRYDP